MTVKYIYIDDLIRVKACRSQVDLFLLKYPSGKMAITKENILDFYNSGGSVLWGLKHLSNNENIALLWREYKYNVARLLIKHNRIETNECKKELIKIRKTYNKKAIEQILNVFDNL